MRNTDYVDVYNDYDFTFYIDSVTPNLDYKFEGKQDGEEPYYIPILWQDVLIANRQSSCFKHQLLRFRPEEEEQIYKELRINLDREKNSFSKKEIENLILSNNDWAIDTVVKIDDLNVLKTIKTELIGLKNTGRYNINSRFEEYLRARIEEVSEGQRQSELEVIPSENEKIELGIIEEEIEEIETPKEDKSQPKKNETPKNKTTGTRKKSTVKK